MHLEWSSVPIDLSEKLDQLLFEMKWMLVKWILTYILDIQRKSSRSDSAEFNGFVSLKRLMIRSCGSQSHHSDRCCTQYTLLTNILWQHVYMIRQWYTAYFEDFIVMEALRPQTFSGCLANGAPGWFRRFVMFRHAALGLRWPEMAWGILPEIWDLQPRSALVNAMCQSCI